MKYKIDFASILHKGIEIENDNFFIGLITGYQGSGKTFYAIYNIERQFKNKTIYTNIKSYKSTKNKILYFEKIEEIYNIDDEENIFLIDELSKKYTKESKQDKSFYSWLQQSRKHKRYVYMITQEYIQVPTWLRGVANTIYTTKKLFRNLCITSVGSPVLDTDTMEWTIDVIGWIIYKRTKKISSLYDTYEYIDTL